MFNQTKKVDSLTFEFNQKIAFIIKQSITYFFRAINLRKHYPEHFRRYFTTCAEIVDQKTDTLFLFRILFLFLIYWAALQLTFAFLSDYFLSPITRAALFDVVLILNVQTKFARTVYIGYCGLILYSIYLHWALYLQGSKYRLNILGVEANLVVGAGGWAKRSRKYNREVNSRRLTVISSENEMEMEDIESGIKEETLEKSISNSNGINPFESTFKSRYNRVKTYRDLDWALYRKQALRVVSFMQIFTAFMDITLIGFMVILCGHFYQNWTSFIIFLLHFPLFLIHLIFFLAFWTSFEATISFFASYAMVGIIYVQLTCHRNYERLKAELKRVRQSFKKMGNSYHNTNDSRLKAILCSNLHLFEVIFLADEFHSQLFTVYLVIFLPASAYCSMGVLLGKLQNGLLGFVILGVVLGNTALGSLAIHCAITHLSGVMHRGGKMLAIWTAKVQSGRGGEEDCERRYQPLPPRLMIHLSTLHITRLLVHHEDQYGPTYYVVGALITMKSLTECILLWGEFVMYAHQLVRNE